MKIWRTLLLPLLVLVGVVVIPAAPAYAGPPMSTYDRLVMQDRPTVYYRWANRTKWYDAVSGLNAKFPRGHTWTYMPDGSAAPKFNGRNQYALRGDHIAFSPDRTGAFTVEAWIRPSTTRFRKTEGSGYVLWAGKGERSGSRGNQEWATRMYSDVNQEGRPNRLSGYVYAPEGGLGAGSYVQDDVRANEWIHYVFVINTRPSREYPMGYTRIYKNGRLRQTADISDFPNVYTANTSAKLRIGTRDGRSWFAGGIGKFAIYNKELPGSRVLAHWIVGKY